MQKYMTYVLCFVVLSYGTNCLAPSTGVNMQQRDYMIPLLCVACCAAITFAYLYFTSATTSTSSSVISHGSSYTTSTLVQR